MHGRQQKKKKNFELTSSCSCCPASFRHNGLFGRNTKKLIRLGGGGRGGGGCRHMGRDFEEWPDDRGAAVETSNQLCDGTMDR